MVASKWLPCLAQKGLYRKVTCCQRGFHLGGFIFLWVTLTAFQGSPNHSLPPSKLGKGSVKLAGSGDGNLQLFPQDCWICQWCREEVSAVPAQIPVCCRSRAQPGATLLQKLQREEQQLLPRSLGFCRGVSLQGPRWPPPGEVQPIFR